MKTSSTTSDRPKSNFSKATINRALMYASKAISNSPILRRHYSKIAKALNLQSSFEAAYQDYLRHAKEFRELNKEL